MRTFIFGVLVLLLPALSVFADQKKETKSKQATKIEATSEKLGEGKVLVKVNGMVCAFCAQGIEKNFNKLDEVKSTKVDLDKMEVSIELEKGKELSEKVIKEVVTGAGFSYVETKK